MMENNSVNSTSQLISESPVKHPDREKNSHGISGFFPAIVNMIVEDGGNFFRYLKDLGLSRENNLVVLSSRHHYFYDENELRSVRTLINLKKLNLIKYLDEFLFSLVQILPDDTKFLGCFSDSGDPIRSVESFIHPIKLLKKINFFESTGHRILTKEKVVEILESNGFKILNMAEIDGLTYFCAQNIRKPVELRA